ncbi:MAG: hypothetical protein E6Q62_07215 [Nitrosomonas sp.]|nr:MAG: hypothetical protein E6Q62_07215 [Nitrosomonas sp.]
MPLIVDELTVWDISFRWSGYDPTEIWFRLPLTVKDNSRLLMQAILHGEIVCETMTLAKRPPDSKADPKYYIRTYTDDVYACIHGKRYNRKLLKWAVLNRMDFHDWCKSRSIPLPEFWFPPGWKLDFEMPELGTYALRAFHIEPEQEGGVHIGFFSPGGVDEESKDQQGEVGIVSRNSNVLSQNSVPFSEKEEVLRTNQRIKIACQQIASIIWKNDRNPTIASVVKNELIQKYGGAASYEEDTVREWIKQVAPSEVRNRRGRPRKNGGEES